jgi:Ca2+/Na+ antiporter
VGIIAFCAPPFLLFTAGQNIFRLGEAELVTLTLLRGALVVAALALLPARGLPARSSGLVSAIAFLGGVAWMDVCADEVVSIFQAMGRILGLPEALLGGTIMCWAASMGDLVATVAVVRRGMANMAVTSCFAGPVFQLLCGLGASLLFINVGRGKEVPVRARSHTHACTRLASSPVSSRRAVTFRLCPTPLAPAAQIILGGNLRLMFAFAVGVLSYYLVGVPVLQGFTLTRRFAKGVLGTYVAFVMAYSYVGLHTFDS